MEEKVINHFCHEHPLILIENVSKDETQCHGCATPVTSEPAYVCVQQTYCPTKPIIHKRCAETPKHISHPAHPHPLHLFDYREAGLIYNCDLCHGQFEDVLGYRCRVCDFDIDISCKPPDTLEVKRLLHPCHRHPLTLMRKPPSLFYCDGCGEEDRDMAYTCGSCEFWVHETCASLTATVPTDHHHHPLSLAFCFPFEHRHRKFEYKCGVCKGEVNMTDWVCYCGDCRFFAHIKCAISKKDTTEIGDQQEGGNFDLIELPVDDISKELIAPFIVRARENNTIANTPDASTIVPETTQSFTSLFNLHEHPLNLVLEAQTDDESMIICDVCVTPIHSPPYYKCTTCKNYFLHSTCHSVPKTLRLNSLYGDCSSTSRNHTLTAYTKTSEFDKNSTCSICEFDTSGILYTCEECKMSIDVKCASLPIAITHASHPHHELTLRRVSNQKSDSECEACEDEIKFSVAYFCNDCDFALDLRCVQLPKNVRHEWDKWHALKLTYDASFDHPTDFYCEICEEEMHPKKWMYHCRDCDLSFHFHCLTGSGKYRNVKFGREFDFRVPFHPHPLEYNRVSLKLRCDVCGEDVYKFPGFECWLCNYVVCENCGLQELRKL